MAMTADEAAFWDRAQAIAYSFRPELIAAILQAFRVIRESLTVAELARVIESGALDELFRQAFSDAMMDRSFIPVRAKLRTATEKSFQYFVRTLPARGKVDGQVAVMFDYLNPRVIEGIRALDSRVITTLKTDLRDVVKAYVENGLRDGANPRTIAKGIRDVIGMAPNQLTAVDNFRRALEGTNPNATPFDYTLRDRRFDGTIRKGGLTPAQIDRMVEAYRKKMLAFNASTNARTASTDAMKLGQQFSWAEAVKKGIVDGGRLVKSWKGVLDDRERDEHIAMEGDTVPWDAPYSNGEMIPGESTYNCRCISRYRIR